MSGSVSCRRATAGAGTSNASTKIRAEVAAAFIRPVTSIVKIWLALLRPFAVNIVTRISSVLEYVSTSLTKTPSRDTRAMPVPGLRPPIQLTVAASVCEPFATLVVSRATEYGAAVSSAPSAAPSNRNWTPATPTLSEASALTLIVPDTVAPFAGAVIDTVGGVLSLNTVTLTELEVYWRPSRSLATAIKVCEPLLAVVVFQEIEYGAVVSSAPRSAPSSLNWTPATTSDPTMLTLARTGTVPATVEPEAGDVIVTMRLPNGGSSCAKARGEPDASPNVNNRVAAKARLEVLSSDRSLVGFGNRNPECSRCRSLSVRADG